MDKTTTAATAAGGTDCSASPSMPDCVAVTTAAVTLPASPDFSATEGTAMASRDNS